LVIASLNGNVVALESNSAVIDVAGVGYLVQLSSKTALGLRLDQTVLLYTALVVRDDGFTLFGFTSASEQRVFDLLRSVTGVGPKSALAILGDLSVEQVIDAVSQDNDSVFKAVSGIGPKTAKLISLTLAGKLGSTGSGSSSLKGQEVSSVVGALTGLGWNERSAIEAANQAVKSLGTSATTNSLLKAALSQLGASKSVGSGDE
jgi:Holliday junction DNA helicase RuvA